jgi:hypothetical protein
VTNTFSDFNNKKHATTSINFTKNLHELHFRASGSGRDGYIYQNNGGFGSPQTVSANPNPSGRFPV